MPLSRAALGRAIVWMDCREASVFRFGAEDVGPDRLSADRPYLKVSHKAGAIKRGGTAADCDFFDRVIDSLRGTHAWCLTGPDNAKDELLGYLDMFKDRDGHIAQLRVKLRNVSSMARPTDEGLLKQARDAA